MTANQPPDVDEPLHANQPRGWGEPPPLPPDLPPLATRNRIDQEGESSAPLRTRGGYRDGLYGDNFEEIFFTPEEFPEGPYGSPFPAN